MQKTKTWYSGYDAKQKEIQEMGFIAARDKFNMDYPPGEDFPNGTSSAAIAYSYGEWAALCDYK